MIRVPYIIIIYATSVFRAYIIIRGRVYDTGTRRRCVRRNRTPGASAGGNYGGKTKKKKVYILHARRVNGYARGAAEVRPRAAAELYYYMRMRAAIDLRTVLRTCTLWKRALPGIT